MSFHDRASDVSRLNRAGSGETIVVHDWTYQVLETSLDLYCRSNGCFNIAVAPALQELGILPAMQDNSTHTALVDKRAFALLAGNRVRMEAECKIDLGGIAKGFAVDRAVSILRQQEIPSGLVNAGGDLVAFGPHDHGVAIRDPRSSTRLMYHVLVRDCALASSGLSFDLVEPSPVEQSAVIDPKSFQPVRAICGASVLASSCMVADALTKVVMITGTGSSRVLDHYGASALFVTVNGEVEMTTNWPNNWPNNWQDRLPVAA
jgi:thiamine biosynthesis lipoprotein